MAKVGRKPVDITGKRSGSVTAIRPDGVDSSGLTLWLCRCDCGKEIHRRTNHINKQITKSCGCQNQRATVHGHTGKDSPTRLVMKVWRQLIARCIDPKHEHYDDYGGRGITVCQRWQDSFDAFLEDMGPRPTPKHSINRKDNDGPYAPDNCEWATRTTQARNTRKNVFLEAFGQRKTLSEWAVEYSIPVGTLRQRLLHGWDGELALTAAVDSRRGTRSAGPQPAFGRTQSVAAWAKEYGIKLQTLIQRMQKGIPLEEALTRPVDTRPRRSKGIE